jgi:hypothetical protein
MRRFFARYFLLIFPISAFAYAMISFAARAASPVEWFSVTHP